MTQTVRERDASTVAALNDALAKSRERHAAAVAANKDAEAYKIAKWRGELHEQLRRYMAAHQALRDNLTMMHEPGRSDAAQRFLREANLRQTAIMDEIEVWTAANLRKEK